MLIFKSASDKFAVINALRLAADKYDDNAKFLRAHPRAREAALAQQFDKQASDARRIADELEQED